MGLSYIGREYGMIFLERADSPYLRSAKTGGEMDLPVYIPYIDAIYLIIAIGLGLIVFTSIGVFFKLWSWKIPRSMAYAFLAVVVVFVVISYLIGNFGGTR